ncbi:hypothetical protein [Henriciella litoralis]|uniref:hypothetical protein n=1 Tax=Henriciella litoralis TaxID=568102 RepID=UPI00111C00C7|nr:hypothetical protein [Henriciella litoralis]
MAREESKAVFPLKRRDMPHARIFDHWMHHPAWMELTSPAFKIIVMLMTSYRPDKPNIFPVGERRVSAMSCCPPRTAKKAIDDLIERGFLRVEQTGRNRGKAVGRERIVSLTHYDTETAAGDPMWPITLWQRRQKNERRKSAA